MSKDLSKELVSLNSEADKLRKKLMNHTHKHFQASDQKQESAKIIL